jgi:hypothetical protein
MKGILAYYQKPHIDTPVTLLQLYMYQPVRDIRYVLKVLQTDVLQCSSTIDIGGVFNRSGGHSTQPGICFKDASETVYSMNIGQDPVLLSSRPTNPDFGTRCHGEPCNNM